MKRFYLLISIITSACLLSCAAPEVEVEQEPAFPNEELIELEEHEFSKVCQELRQYVAEAETQATKLPNFKFHGDFGELGYYTDSSRTNFITMQEIVHEELLPDASLVLEKCQECRICVTDTLSTDPYDKPQTVVEETEIPTIEQWRDICLGLQDDLEEAITTVQECEDHADILFRQIAMDINAKVWAKENYLPKFKSSCDRYRDICDNTITNLENAMTAAGQLQTWKFEALAVPEQQQTN